MTQELPVHRGTLRGLRTFRVTDEGRLAPVTNRPPWVSGVSSAVCDRRGLLRRRNRHHAAPAPGCTCGLWAFGGLQALRESGLPGTARVVAVVGAHGRAIPGELGFRAEHAVVEAVWLSPRIPSARRAAVAENYPTTAVYTSLAGMVAEHPCSELPSYRLPLAPDRRALLGQLAVVLAWAAGILGWWATTTVPTAATVPANEYVAAAIAATPLIVAGAATLMLALHPRRWPWHLALLLPQTGLLLVGQEVLDDVTAVAQLTVAATTATLMHAVSAALATGRLLRLDVRRLLPAR